MRDIHLEEFLWLADVTQDAVLLAWGGFYFGRDSDDEPWRLVPAAELGPVDPGRTLTVGARSQSYGPAVVTVTDDSGTVVGTARSSEVNHAWVPGLRPDTRYHYRVEVNGTEWAAGERWDWGPVGDGGLGLAPRGRRYIPTFRTAPVTDAPLDFAVLGDFGVGTYEQSEAGARQLRIAGVLDRLVADDAVRLVLTTGDNVYDGGHVDADWYGSYFHPYRYVLARVPVYPTVGNHDSAETERSDNRDILNGNFHIDERFPIAAEGRRVRTEHGLNYRFGHGSSVEFVCIDSSEGLDGPHPHHYEHPEAQEFLRDVLHNGPGRPRWRIAFCHHPPYGAGPEHAGGSEPMREWVVPLLRDGGVDVLLSGHEHNFQYARADGVDYVVTGAAGKLSEETPQRFAEAHTAAWAAQAHLLHVRIDGRRMTVTPASELTATGRPRPLTVRAPDGGRMEGTFDLSPAGAEAPVRCR